MPSLEENRKQVRIAMKRANQFLPTLSIVCFALTPLGCTKTDSLGAAGQDGSGLDKNAPKASGDSAENNVTADSGISDGGGTCPLLFPSSPVYYPSDVGSPCPAAESSLVDATQMLSCAPSSIGVRCAYPSPISGDLQDIFTCTDATGTNDPNGHLVTFGAYWAGPSLSICKRSGNDCDIDSSLGPASSRVDLTRSCDNRTPQNCSIGADVTAQEALDQMMVGVVASCLNSALLARTTDPLQTAALSVWFEGDCPTSFVVYPAQFADCVQAQLENQSFPCASGLSCSTSGQVGGCPCSFR
jgi:hypothetical protein